MLAMTSSCYCLDVLCYDSLILHNVFQQRPRESHGASRNTDHTTKPAFRPGSVCWWRFQFASSDCNQSDNFNLVISQSVGLEAIELNLCKAI